MLKIFVNKYYNELENNINKYIANKKIKEIQYKINNGYIYAFILSEENEV